MANSFRQAWERASIQAGSAPRDARSGRTNRGSGQEMAPLPQGPWPPANPPFSQTTPAKLPCYLYAPLCSTCTCAGLFGEFFYILASDQNRFHTFTRIMKYISSCTYMHFHQYFISIKDCMLSYSRCGVFQCLKTSFRCVKLCQPLA